MTRFGWLANYGGMTERRERTVIDRPVGTEVRVETMPGGVRITLIEPAAKPSYQERRR